MDMKIKLSNILRRHGVRMLNKDVDVYVSTMGVSYVTLNDNIILELLADENEKLRIELVDFLKTLNIKLTDFLVRGPFGFETYCKNGYEYTNLHVGVRKYGVLPSILIPHINEVSFVELFSNEQFLWSIASTYHLQGHMDARELNHLCKQDNVRTILIDTELRLDNMSELNMSTIRKMGFMSGRQLYVKEKVLSFTCVRRMSA